jgi:hypothetical protein
MTPSWGTAGSLLAAAMLFIGLVLAPGRAAGPLSSMSQDAVELQRFQRTYSESPFDVATRKQALLGAAALGTDEARQWLTAVADSDAALRDAAQRALLYSRAVCPDRDVR